jgi:tetratricopeptide (TPR) repeat protein
VVAKLSNRLDTSEDGRWTLDVARDGAGVAADRDCYALRSAVLVRHAATIRTTAGYRNRSGREAFVAIFQTCQWLWVGQPDIAIEHIEASLRLNPRARVGWGLNAIAAAHMTCHRFNEALSVVLVLIEEDPSPIACQSLIACHAHLGRLTEARESYSILEWGLTGYSATSPGSRNPI